LHVEDEVCGDYGWDGEKPAKEVRVWSQRDLSLGLEDNLLEENASAGAGREDCLEDYNGIGDCGMVSMGYILVGGRKTLTKDEYKCPNAIVHNQSKQRRTAPTCSHGDEELVESEGDEE
jgi:hypothetical protein